MKTRLIFLVFILGLQTAWIVGTSAVQERRLAAGTCILLETRPVDPRDLIRGDYVILSYKASDLPSTLFQPPLTDSPPVGARVYVVLEQQGEFHVPVAASTLELRPGANQVMLVATAEPGFGSFNVNRLVHVKYGLERFYVREGTGNPRGKLTVEVAVPSSGHAKIKQVYVDGTPFAEAMKGHRD